MQSTIFKRGNTFYLRVYVPKQFQGAPHLRTASGRPRKEIVRGLGGTRKRQEAEERRAAVFDQVYRFILGIPSPDDYAGTHDDVHDGEVYTFTHPELEAVAESIEKLHGLPKAKSWYNEAAGVVTFENAGDFYTAHRQNRDRSVKTRTIEKHAKHLDTFRRWYGGSHVRPRDITVSTANKFVDHLQREGYADNTVNDHVSSLSQVWKFLKAKHSAVDHDIWTGLTISSPQFTNDKRAMTPEETRVFAAALEDTDEAARDLLLLQLFTGARVDEPCNWRVSDVIWENGEAVGVWSTVGKKTIRAKMRRSSSSSSASDTSGKLWVPLASRATLIVNARAIGKPADAYVLDGYTPGNGSRSRSANILKKANRWLHVVFPDDPEITSHSMRKTHATAAENAGLSLDQVDRLQNRSTGTLSGDVYSAGLEKDRLSELQSRAAAVLDGWMSGKDGSR